MTLVAAVKMADGRVMMVGDSFVGSDGDNHNARIMKLRRAGRVILGVAGPIACQDFFMELLDVPEFDDIDPAVWMKRVFGGAVRASLKKHNISASILDSEALVAVGGEIFAFQGRVGTHGFGGDFGVVGSGSPWAQGVLEVTGKLTPRVRLGKAMKVASKYSGSIRAPFTFLTGGT